MLVACLSTAIVFSCLFCW